MRLNLAFVPGDYAVCRLEPDAPVPDWAWHGAFSSVTRTSDELSIVCDSSVAPQGIKLERGWACMKLRGPFDFNLTGVLTSVLEPLRDAGIGIFAVSTFDTDYVLVKHTSLEVAVDALERAGHEFER
ncbi:MAG: ACT domain-containing protein [Pleurocapsa sp. SU_196_0]|nr:ACT domain-containing protein [Pleurocapsa sp. SU_196_0]